MRTLLAVPLCSKRSDKDAWGCDGESTWRKESDGDRCVEAAKSFLWVGVLNQGRHKKSSVTFSIYFMKRDWNSFVFSMKAIFQHKNQKDFTAPSVPASRGFMLCGGSGRDVFGAGVGGWGGGGWRQ